MYEGISDRNLSCPAVSHNCNRTVRSSRYIVFDRKSMPMVACAQNGKKDACTNEVRYHRREWEKGNLT
jgi:hypothetical protein